MCIRDSESGVRTSRALMRGAPERRRRNSRVGIAEPPGLGCGTSESNFRSSRALVGGAPAWMAS
eukprot:11567366-Alexandrium_andersonii.AAC.1